MTSSTCVSAKKNIKTTNQKRGADLQRIKENEKMEELKIERYLLNKGIPPHLKGFQYMVTAIKLCQENNDYLYNVTKKLYPQLAKIYNDSYSRTERCLRTTLTHLSHPHTNSSFLGTALIELRELYGDENNDKSNKCKKKNCVSKSKAY